MKEERLDNLDSGGRKRANGGSGGCGRGCGLATTPTRRWRRRTTLLAGAVRRR